MHLQLGGWGRFLDKIMLGRYTKKSPLLSAAVAGLFLGFGLTYTLFTFNVIPGRPCRIIFPQLGPPGPIISDVEVKAERELALKDGSYLNKPLEGNVSGVMFYVKGGIGNQLFHYACTYALARDQQVPLFNMVPLAPPSRGFLTDEREFALDKFQIPLTNQIDGKLRIDPSTVTLVNDYQLHFRTYPRQSTFLRVEGDSFCIGYSFWAQYKKDIVAMFQLKPEVIQGFQPYVTNLAKDIDNSDDSVAVHIRIGYDFRKKGNMDLPISFQRDSMFQITNMLDQRRKTDDSSKPSRRPKFFIFSDDIEYCRRELKNISSVHDLVFVSSSGTGITTTSLEDFFLMTKCKHFIIPNSTFSWWAAYLGTNKGNGSSANSDSIVLVSDDKPSYWKWMAQNWFRDERELSFYRDVIHEFFLFPSAWIVYKPSD